VDLLRFFNRFPDAADPATEGSADEVPSNRYWSMSNQGSIWRVDWARLVPRYAFIMFFSTSSLWVCRVFVTGFECTLGADWVMFHDTARLLLSSQWGEIYPGVTANYPFFYPPYFVPFLAPLGLLSRSWA